MELKQEEHEGIAVLNYKNLTKRSSKRQHFRFYIPNLVLFKKYRKSTLQPKEKMAGIYCLLCEGMVIYIGKTADINKRFRYHKHREKFDSYLFYPEKNRVKGGLYETYLIHLYKPILNLEFKRLFI